MGGTRAEVGAQMENFFERVGHVWPVGRRDLHWHILPTRAEAGVLATSYQV